MKLALSINDATQLFHLLSKAIVEAEVMDDFRTFDSNLVGNTVGEDIGAWIKWLASRLETKTSTTINGAFNGSWGSCDASWNNSYGSE